MTDYLSKNFYKEMKEALRDRVSPRRFEHSKAVVKTCKWIAKTYGVDKEKARLAAILHDWDKGLTDEQEIEKAKQFGLSSSFSEWEMENLPNLLHGPTAAAEFNEAFPLFPKDVLHAISVHTTADLNMNDLDMCLYVADAIEPTRDYRELDELRSLVGSIELCKLYETVFCLWTIKLIECKKLIKPSTIDIYNNIVAKK